ncbi:MAG: helix-turn-helix domain-containing protein [Clostridiaceae bacterium]|nr:helix-turn-helix domain-containing protein [Clostridiaceae bacterium]
MDIVKVGKAIAYLRKQAGYTQKELAELIGISDKAVSKWERGVGLPDIAYLGRLAVLLDTDTDSLLAGDAMSHGKRWSGLLIFPKNSYDVKASTQVYGKPVVNFLLSYFLLAGIKNIVVAGSEEDKDYLDSEFGDGNKIGINLSCLDDFYDIDSVIDCSNVMVVFGRTFIYGASMTRLFRRAMANNDRATVLSIPKSVEDNLQRLYFDVNKKVVNMDSLEKRETRYDYAQIPILFCPKSILNRVLVTNKTRQGLLSINLSDPSFRNEFLYTDFPDRGYIEFPIDTLDDVADASIFVRMLEKSSRSIVYCLEEIAWRRGMISLEQMKQLGNEKAGTEYGNYILSLCDR